MSLSVSAKRIPFFAAAVSLSAAAMIFSFFVAPAFASGQITNRSLTLQDGATDGGSKPSGVVNHLFTFTIPSGVGTVKSIVFHYCKTVGGTGGTADIDQGGACTTPTGLSTTSATDGASTTGSLDSINVTTNGSPYFDSTSGIATGSPVTLSAQFDTVTNPDGTDCAGANNNCAFYVAILAYDNTGGTGSLIAYGTVAASVNQQIQLSGTMPESLIFCTGGSVSTTGTSPNTIPDCTTATSGSISFNKLFSPTGTAYASSQMAASTNALHGYAITVSGKSLTNGSYHIPGIGGTAASDTGTVGSNKFGLNLVADTNANASTPALSVASADLNPASDSSNYWGTAESPFTTGDSYAFSDSDSSLTLNDVAASDFGQPGTAEPTNGQVYTVTYMANVAANLPAGSYSTTLTYICTPTF
jgi:hypothetical protein